MAIVSEGTTLADSTGSIANVRSISGPTQSAGDIDVSHLGTSGGYREYLPSFRDGGTVTFEVFYDPSENSHLTMAGGLPRHFNEQDTDTWTLTLSSGDAIEFDARVSELSGPNVSVDDAATMSVTLKVSGAVTFPS